MTKQSIADSRHLTLQQKNQDIHKQIQKFLHKKSWAVMQASLHSLDYSREVIFFKLFGDICPHSGVYFFEKYHKTFLKILVFFFLSGKEK